MPDAMDERRRGLEEEYFNRKNKEAIEKLRAKIKVAEEAKAAGLSSMKCPRCDGALQETKFEEIAVDVCGKFKRIRFRGHVCDKCGGVWLDSGELEHLTRKPESAGWFSRLWFSEG